MILLYPVSYSHTDGFDSQLVIGITQGITAIGLLVFAGMQWWLTRNAEKSRLSERRLDKQQSLDSSYGVVWAEYNRILRLSERFGSADVVLAVHTGILNPADVLPRDWAQSTVTLGQLGLVSAELGAVAYSPLHEVATRIRRMQTGLERGREDLRPHLSVRRASRRSNEEPAATRGQDPDG